MNEIQVVTAEEIDYALAHEFDSEREKREKPDRPDNYISQIGEHCLRRLFYERTAQDKKEPYPPRVLRKMREGRRQELHTKDDTTGLGYEWIRAQSYVAIHDLSLTGKVEGYVKRSTGSDKNAALGEIKSLDGHSFDAHCTIELLDQNIFFSRYLDQCTGYMVAKNEETCILFLKNRSSGEIKPLQFDLDLDRWSLLKEKITEVNMHVDENVPCDRINNNLGDDSYCKSCPFRMLCLPDVIQESYSAIQFIDAPEVAEKLRRMEELKDAHKEYESLKKWRKKRFENIDRVVIDEFLITGKIQKRKGFTVDPSESWIVSVTTLEKGA